MATAVQFYNEEYERCLLAIMLLDNSLIDLISGRIKSECFYNTMHKYIYEKICKQWQKDQCVNIVSLLNNDPKLKPDYVANITNAIGSASNWTFYVEKLNELFNARKIKREVGTILEGVSPENLSKVISDLEASIAGYSVTKTDSYSMKDLAMRNLEQVQKAFTNKVLISGYESGFGNLDNLLDGFQKNNMYVLGARPSIGKTAFALSLVTGLAEKGANIAVFSLEMSADALYYRMLSSVSGLPMWQIKKGFLSESMNTLAKYDKANEKLYSLPVSIMDTDIDNDKLLYSRIRYEAKVNKADVIVIDHLGLIEVSDSSGQRYVDVGRITKTLHNMARELNVCVIVLAQCGREAEGKKPNLALLRESGNIEQDADVIMLIHRQRELDNTDKDDSLAELPTDVIVAKNRDGKTGTAHFLFRPNCMRFTEDNSGRANLEDFLAKKESKKDKSNCL